MMNNKIEALYIHIPFCNHICNYCDFYKMIAKDNIKNQYIEYLLKELDFKSSLLKDIKTIYIGGGTPASLSLEQLEKLFIGLSKKIDLEKVLEFTIESNPLDINDQLVKLLKKYHVNRISIGVQSTRSEKLALLGRNHNYNDVVNAVTTLKKNQFTNINIDYMYGVLDTLDSVKKELDLLLSLGITHISTYSLILEPKTILYQRYQSNQFAPLDEDLEAEIYYFIQEYLVSKDFIQYEISNFSIKNHQSIHNLTYWNNAHYLGIGAFSSYYIESTRYTNINNLKKYFMGIDEGQLIYFEKLELSIEDMMAEEMMLGLRKIEGISIDEFHKKFNKDIFTVYPQINKLLKNNLLMINNNRITIPKNKLYISNAIMMEFI